MQRLIGFRASLKRGALLTAANWPIVIIQFVADTIFKILVAIPVVGGALLAALLLGADLEQLLGGDWRDLLGAIAGALLSQPLALAAFVFALTIVVLAGSVLMFLIKGGVVSTLVESEALAGPLEQPPLRLAAFWRASHVSIERFIDGCARLFPRYLRLGLGLLLVYLASGALYLATIIGAYRVTDNGRFFIEGTMIAAAGSTALILWITVVNLFYLLTQMVMAVEDCPLVPAMRRGIRFVLARPLDIAIVFGLVLILVVVATAGSMVAAAGLGLISFVPLVGLAVLPLQVAAWLVRGVVFQYLGLTALGAYISLYRPLAERSAGGLADLERDRPTSPFSRTA